MPQTVRLFILHSKTMTNKSHPGLSAEHHTSTPEYGTITHVAIHRNPGLVTAIGLDNERLDESLGQAHAVPAGVVPVIGQALPGIAIARNALNGAAL